MSHIDHLPPKTVKCVFKRIFTAFPNSSGGRGGGRGLITTTSLSFIDSSVNEEWGLVQNDLDLQKPNPPFFFAVYPFTSLSSFSSTIGTSVYAWNEVTRKDKRISAATCTLRDMLLEISCMPLVAQLALYSTAYTLSLIRAQARSPIDAPSRTYNTRQKAARQPTRRSSLPVHTRNATAFESFTSAPPAAANPVPTNQYRQKTNQKYPAHLPSQGVSDQQNQSWLHKPDIFHSLSQSSHRKSCISRVRRYMDPLYLFWISSSLVPIRGRRLDLGW